MKRKWVRPAVYAEAYGVCAKTVKRWVDKGLIPPMLVKKTKGGQVRVALEASDIR